MSNRYLVNLFQLQGSALVDRALHASATHSNPSIPTVAPTADALCEVVSSAYNRAWLVSQRMLWLMSCIAFRGRRGESAGAPVSVGHGHGSGSGA